jgi:hypothetical protein
MVCSPRLAPNEGFKNFKLDTFDNFNNFAYFLNSLKNLTTLGDRCGGGMHPMGGYNFFKFNHFET